MRLTKEFLEGRRAATQSLLDEMPGSDEHLPDRFYLLGRINLLIDLIEKVEEQ